MNKNSVLGGIVLLVLGLALGYASSGRTFTPDGYMPQAGMMSQTIDRHFITQMIPHHEGAIVMAHVALKRSKRSEVLALANDIIRDQQKEIDDMRAWYQDWYGTDVPRDVGMGMMHMDSMEGDTKVLESAPAADFDRLFVTQMIPHHEMAIVMAQMLEAGTQRSEMKQLAANIISSQSREIKMMREWLVAWGQ